MKFLIFLSEAMVPLMIFYIVGFGLLSGRPVLDDFIDGAKAVSYTHLDVYKRQSQTGRTPLSVSGFP